MAPDDADPAGAPDDGSVDAASPAERRRMRVRSAILDAAEKVFAEEGEEGLSIRRLAEEIDYSPAAIYRYFASKDELVDELKEAFFERILVLIEVNRASAAPFPVRMRNCVSAYIRTALEKPHHYAAAFSGFAQQAAAPIHLDIPEGPVRAEGPLLSNKARAFDFLVEMIATGQAGGYLRTDIDPAAAAFCAWSACHGMAMIMIHTQALPAGEAAAPDGPLETIIASHADICVRGLETDPGAAPRAAAPHKTASQPAPAAGACPPAPQDPSRHD